MKSCVLELFTLGPPRIVHRGKTVYLTSRKAEALLYYVLMRRTPIQRDALVTLFWPDSTENSARSRLRAELSTLRQLFGDVLDISRYAVGVKDPNLITLDARNLYLAAKRRDFDCWLNALSSYRGDFLDGFRVGNAPAFEDWLLGEQRYLWARAMEGYQFVTAAYERRGLQGLALEHAWRWTSHAPLSEQAQMCLIRLLAATGQRNLALLQYRFYCGRLAERLGLTPTLELKRLATAIAGQEMELDSLTGILGRS